MEKGEKGCTCAMAVAGYVYSITVVEKGTHSLPLSSLSKKAAGLHWPCHSCMDIDRQGHNTHTHTKTKAISYGYSTRLKEEEEEEREEREEQLEDDLIMLSCAE